VLLFLFSGWALLMFRDSFIPLRASTRAWVAVVLVWWRRRRHRPASGRLPAAPWAVQTIALAAVLTTWGLCVVEPIATFWLASRGRPAVEGARMRALSLGYAGIVAVIMFGSLGGALVQNDEAQLALDLLALAIVPMLFFSFYPPRGCAACGVNPRRRSCGRGCTACSASAQTAGTQAQRALEWATRLVGGAGALIVDSDSSILASRGLSETRATEIAAAAAANAKGGEVRSPRRGRRRSSSRWTSSRALAPWSSWPVPSPRCLATTR